MILRIIIGFVIAGIGFMVVWKSEWMHQNFGTITWAEEHLGSNGGSRLMYKLIGLAAIFIGFIVITNLQQQFLNATVGKLFGIHQDQTQ